MREKSRDQDGEGRVDRERRREKVSMCTRVVCTAESNRGGNEAKQ